MFLRPSHFFENNYFLFNTQDAGIIIFHVKIKRQRERVERALFL
jgi:hypothetical protein